MSFCSGKADAEKFGLEVEWTEEEEALLKEMEGVPLTEYQERCLKIDEYQKIYESRNDVIKDQIAAYNGSIRATRLERLKFREMEKAQKKAEEVMEAAGKFAAPKHHRIRNGGNPALW